jgi:hypothetical protein
MLGAKEALLDTFKAHARDFDIFAAIQPLAMAGRARGACVGTYPDITRRGHLSSKPALPIFLELSEKHYPELKLTDALLKYENVTIEELIERRAQRRAAEQRAEEEASEQENKEQQRGRLGCVQAGCGLGV